VGELNPHKCWWGALEGVGPHDQEQDLENEGNKDIPLIGAVSLLPPQSSRHVSRSTMVW